MSTSGFHFAFFCIFALTSISESFRQSEILLNDILKGYKRTTHPSIISRSKTNVSITLHLYHLNVPNHPTPKIEFESYLSMFWRDDRIAWNPSEYNYTHTVSVPYPFKTRVWLPKIMRMEKTVSFLDYVDKDTSQSLAFFNSAFHSKKTAVIEYLSKNHGAFDCESSGSFPREILNCSTFFVTMGSDEIFTGSFHISDLYMNDLKDGGLNGWNIVDRRQKEMRYDVMDEVLVEKNIKVEHSLSAVYFEIVIQRAGWTLPIVVLTPYLAIGMFIAFAWLVKPSFALHIFCAAMYMLTVFMKDSVSGVEAFTDGYKGLDIAVLSLWTSCFVGVIFHLLSANCHDQSQPNSKIIAILLKTKPELLERLQKRVKIGHLLTDYEISRAAIALLLFVLFPIVLFLL